MNSFEIIEKLKDANRVCICRPFSSAASFGFVALLRHTDLGDEASAALASTQVEEVLQAMIGALAAIDAATGLRRAHATAEHQRTQFSAVVGIARQDSCNIDLHVVGDACVMLGSNDAEIVIPPELMDYGTGIYNVLRRALGTHAFKADGGQSTARIDVDSRLKLVMGMFLPGSELAYRASNRQALPAGFVFEVQNP